MSIDLKRKRTVDYYATALTWTPMGKRKVGRLKNHLAPHCGEREGNGGLEVLGGSESPG